jgi:YggT family protein
MLIQIIDAIFWVYMIMLFLRILSSWIPEFAEYRIVQFLAFCTDPYLNLFRAVIPPIGPMDISPIVAFLCLSVIELIVKWGVLRLFY